MTSELMQSATQAERNAHRLRQWEAKWLYKFGTLPGMTPGVVAIRPSVLARKEAACLSTVELASAGDIAEKHGTVPRNIIPMLRHRCLRRIVRPVNPKELEA
jgi:hypothetical protein